MMLLKACSDSAILDPCLSALAGAAAELLHVSIVPKQIPGEKVTATQKQDLLYRATKLSQGETILVAQSLPQWERRIVSAVTYLDLAKASAEPSEQHTKIEQVHAGTLSLLKYLYQEVYDLGGLTLDIVSDIPEFLQNYLTFGIISPFALSRALAEDLNFQTVLRESSQLIGVDLYSGIEHRICPKEWAEAVRLFKFHPPSHSYSERTMNLFLRLLDSADAVAAMARQATLFSSFVEATQVAHLLYSTSARGLAWLIEKYEREGLTPPPELWREQQVAEENRAVTGEVIEHPWHTLALSPVAHLVNHVLLTKTIPGKERLMLWLLDGIARIVVYPDVVRHMWTRLVEGFQLGRPVDYRAAAHGFYMTLYHEWGISSALATCFTDVPVARTFLSVEMGWPRDDSLLQRMKEHLRNRGSEFL